jgi:hypothetical protein
VALTFDPGRVEPLTLAEFTGRVARLDLGHPGSYDRVAELMAGLAANRTLLSAAVNEQLADLARFQRDNRYQPESIFLARGDDFRVRANLWVPPAGNPSAGRELTHEIPHDHNYGFFTVGYLGAGYRTTIWEYAPSGVAGAPGERVGIDFLEETTLPQGKVMFYRPSQDIHAQHTPEAFAVSLNLVLPINDRDQLLFDPDGCRVRGTVGRQDAGRELLTRLARFTADADTPKLLDRLAETHPLPSVRQSARESLTGIG